MPATFPPFTPRTTRPLAWTSLAVAALLSGCGSYEPPQPGVYREVGENKAEYACGLETPTATLMAVTRCRNIADAKARGDQAREAADSIRTPPPDVRGR